MRTENRFCPCQKRSTSHSINGSEYRCQVCGSVKTRTHKAQPSMGFQPTPSLYMGSTAPRPDLDSEEEEQTRHEAEQWRRKTPGQREAAIRDALRLS